MGGESGAGTDDVGCEGTAAVSMAAWILAVGRWLLARWLCAVVGGVRHRWMRLLRHVLRVLGVGGRIRRWRCRGRCNRGVA